MAIFSAKIGFGASFSVYKMTAMQMHFVHLLGEQSWFLIGQVANPAMSAHIHQQLFKERNRQDAKKEELCHLEWNREAMLIEIRGTHRINLSNFSVGVAK